MAELDEIRAGMWEDVAGRAKAWIAGVLPTLADRSPDGARLAFIRSLPQSEEYPAVASAADAATRACAVYRGRAPTAEEYRASVEACHRRDSIERVYGDVRRTAGDLVWRAAKAG
ncbi:MAG TPA: hypothetical protein VHH11_13865 [Gammaproteobacteria bacterium]|nr:hypothetical protein [Gammaproteobacteria bacterium]